MTPTEDGMSDHEWEAVTSGIKRLEDKVDNLTSCFTTYKLNATKECNAKHEPINRLLPFITLRNVLFYAVAILLTNQVVSTIGWDEFLKYVGYLK